MKINISNSRYDHIHLLDKIHMLEVRGHKYCLTVDRFSRFLMAVPLKNVGINTI